MQVSQLFAGRMRLWVGILALASCSREAAREGTTDGPTGRLALLTYNVQARPLLDTARAVANLPVIGRMLAEFGVANVQECFSECQRLLDAAPQTHEYYFSQLQTPLSLANSGLAGVSWFPIDDLVTVHYRAKAELADAVASKGIALGRINVDGFAVDIYNTHMQAGDSDAAHGAQSSQADELIAFVTANSAANSTVIVQGDFNMSPERPGKRFEEFTPNHYSNDADMRARTANFQKIVDRLGLADVSDVLFGPTRDHIDRVLYRAASGVKMTPRSWEDRSGQFVDANGAPLSDSIPLAVVLSFETATR